MLGLLVGGKVEMGLQVRVLGPAWFYSLYIFSSSCFYGFTGGQLGVDVKIKHNGFLPTRIHHLPNCHIRVNISKDVVSKKRNVLFTRASFAPNKRITAPLSPNVDHACNDPPIVSCLEK